MQKVLMVALLVLPIVLFLAFFADDIMNRFTSNAGATSTQGDTVEDTAAQGPGFGTD